MAILELQGVRGGGNHLSPQHSLGVTNLRGNVTVIDASDNLLRMSF